jgi:mannose-P-dolichol utilization defect protein 1
VFLNAQNFLILCAIMAYTKGGRFFSFFLLSSLTAAVASVALRPELLDNATLTFLQGLSIPASIISKIPQVYSNFANGSTGQLSGEGYFVGE